MQARITREAVASGSPRSGVEVNAERLEQELALLVQKMDVAEELDRLKQSRDGIHGDARLRRRGRTQARLPLPGAEPRGEHARLQVGRQRDDAHRAVELKVLIEQMREQIQNVE